MGLLDDAIREHLELKKRSGASEDEIKRLENEALGGPRRVPAPSEAEETELEAAVGDPVAEDPEAAVPVEELVEDPPAPIPAEAALPLDPDPADEPALEHDVPAAAVEPPPAPTTPAPAAPAPPRRDPVVEDQGDWFEDPDEVPAAESLEADEDVLEETPEFLQETPEHERLWFEQKPPRDFDFGA